MSQRYNKWDIEKLKFDKKMALCYGIVSGFAAGFLIAMNIWR